MLTFAHAQASLQLELPPTLVFDHPTTAAITTYLSARLTPGGDGSSDALQGMQLGRALAFDAGGAAVVVTVLGASSPGWELHR